MSHSEGQANPSRTFALLCSVAVVAALYWAKEVFLPIALAILLTFLLTPLVKRLEKWNFRRVPAVLVVVSVSCAGVALLSFVLAHQLYDLAYRLPEYRGNLVAKARAFQSREDSVLAKVSETLKDVQQQLAPPKRAPHEAPEALPPVPPSLQALAPPGSLSPAPATSDKAESPAPVPVEVIDELSAAEIARSVVGPLVAPVGMAALVIVFVIFMLIEREDLRNRLIHLIGSRQLSQTTQAIDDAAFRVSRFLLMQLAVNSLYGVMIAAGLFMIGLPNALLWGVLATVFRFVPYVGPWIAAVIPLAVSLAVFDGWTRPALVMSLFLVNELISNNVLEPWLYGASAGISTMGILVSAVFWAWLWGPIGLILSTPLTVCLTVIGRYVPQLDFLNTLLSDEEVLPPEKRFYQRLLALDPEEAIEVADAYLEEHALEALYDRVLVPALSLAEQDRHRGELDEFRQKLINQTIHELVDDLGVKARAANAALEAAPTGDEATAEKKSITILCLPARDEADELTALMLAQLLDLRGVPAEVVSSQLLISERVEQVETRGADIVCIASLPPFAATHARYLCKRLRPKHPDLRIVVGLWHSGGSSKKAQQRLAGLNIERSVGTLAEAAEQLARLVATDQMLTSKSEPTPAPTTT